MLVKEDDDPKTTFRAGSSGHYKFIWMPFGLSNLGSNFYHLMEMCLNNQQFIRSFICNMERPSVKQSIKQEVSSNLADEPSLADEPPNQMSNGNFTLLLISTGLEWQFHIATDI